MCAPAGVKGFALYAAEHGTPWLLVNRQGAAQPPSPWQGALPKMSNGKDFCAYKLPQSVRASNRAGAGPDVLQFI